MPILPTDNDTRGYRSCGSLRCLARVGWARAGCDKTGIRVARKRIASLIPAACPPQPSPFITCGIRHLESPATSGRVARRKTMKPQLLISALLFMCLSWASAQAQNNITVLTLRVLVDNKKGDEKPAQMRVNFAPLVADGTQFSVCLVPNDRSGPNGP